MIDSEKEQRKTRESEVQGAADLAKTREDTKEECESPNRAPKK